MSLNHSRRHRHYHRNREGSEPPRRSHTDEVQPDRKDMRRQQQRFIRKQEREGKEQTRLLVIFVVIKSPIKFSTERVVRRKMSPFSSFAFLSHSRSCGLSRPVSFHRRRRRRRHRIEIRILTGSKRFSEPSRRFSQSLGREYISVPFRIIASMR